MIHTYEGETISFEIKYKNRSTVGISIDIYGNIEVIAPKKTPDHRVIQVLEFNWDLIQSKIKETKERLNGPQVKDFQDEEKFLYLGISYPIKIVIDNTLTKESVDFDKKVLYVYVKQQDKEKIKQSLTRFYYQQCKSLVEERISLFQSNFKTKPRSIRIIDSNNKWGTCDSNFHLTFNWKLAMAPLDVIDYVVVHEMCHMAHLNHDRSFWRLVGKIIPDYKAKEKWLTVSGWKMTV
ncbi:MAG: zinc protease [Bacillales bacterium]|jgi:predicted metal-dependent hydrolase|nr:zinc protease [Bacillales bacterium]